MEEKWWSKFQTKTSDDNKKAPNDYLRMEDIKEVVEEELQEKFEEAVSAGKKSTEEILHWANQTIERTPDAKVVFETAKGKAQDMKEWAEFTLQSPEVQDAMMTAKIKANEAIGAGSRMVGGVKQWTTETLDQPEVRETFGNVKDIVRNTAEDSMHMYDDAKLWARQTLDKKEVRETVQTVKEKTEDAFDVSKQFVNQGVEWANDLKNRPEVQHTFSSVKEMTEDAFDASKQFVNQGVEWATDLKNSPEVQSTISNVKGIAKDVTDDVKDGFERIVRDPNVQKNVQNVKTSVNSFADKASSTIKHEYNDIKDSTDLKGELKELGKSALTLGKQSARVVMATVEEIRTNETVIATVEKGKEISLSLFQKAKQAVKNKMEEKQRRSSEYRQFLDDQQMRPGYRRHASTIESEELSDEEWDFDDTTEDN